MKKLRGTACLVLAAIVWGMAFVAQTAAADSVGAFTFNASRCLIAGVFLLALIGARRIFGNKKAAEAQPRHMDKKTLFKGMTCGVVLFFGMTLQQAGIAAYPAGEAVSGRSGFITATYVVMVAVFTWIKSRHMRINVIVAAAGCIAGMYMLCMSEGFSGIYMGDVLVLLSAVAFAAYLLMIDRLADIDGLYIACIQFFTTGMISAVCMALFEKADITALASAWLPIVYAGVFSSGVGYTLQIAGQRYTEPTVASIVMSLESVFAAIAGWFMLGERLSPVELLGCGVMFGAVILSQLPEKSAACESDAAAR